MLNPLNELKINEVNQTAGYLVKMRTFKTIHQILVEFASYLGYHGKTEAGLRDVMQSGRHREAGKGRQGYNGSSSHKTLQGEMVGGHGGGYRSWTNRGKGRGPEAPPSLRLFILKG